MENDGGKLPSTFCKDPKQVAESVSKPSKTHPVVETKKLAKKESLVEAKPMPPTEITSKPVKKHPVVETPMPLARAGSGLGSRNSSRTANDADAGPTPSFGRQKSVVEMKSKFTQTVKSNEEIEEEVRKEINKAREVERAQAGKTIAVIEEQIASLQATVAKLKGQVS